MTDVLLVCNKSGMFKSVKALGHASYSSKGSDIVCAAITILLRTAIDVLEKTDGISLSVDSSSRGNLAFLVEDAKEKTLDEITKSRLICVGDFLRQGLSSLAQEFPENVQLRETIN